jgi:2-polyprenyl-6-hydroxyphenyl methylase/3-demethylubiquinone-9 3-methyltransferase
VRPSHPADDFRRDEPKLATGPLGGDVAEVGRFAATAEEWWDPQGRFRALHRLNPARLGFIRSRFLLHFQRDPDRLQPFEGLCLLDIGCGGGLVAEPMARLGFTVTAADVEPAAIAAAQAHARTSRLAIDYRVASVETLAAHGRRFDAILALEVIEHVADPQSFWRALGSLLVPGGIVICATINRTVRSFTLAVLGAEFVLGWIPPGTHQWQKFLRPSELALGLRRNGLRPTEIVGFSYALLTDEWVLSRDLSVNYLVVARRL